MRKFVLLVFISFFCCASCAGAEKKEIKASDILKTIKKGKPVQIVGKIILDDLDFTQANEPFVMDAFTVQTEITSNVFFSHCVFMGKVTSNNSKGKTNLQSVFKNNLIFNNCDFRGEVDFSDAVVFGKTDFSQSTFRKQANFNNISVWSKGSYFDNMVAEQNFSMIYAFFWGNLSFLDAKFQAKSSFQEIKVTGNLSFINAVFADNVDFALMETGRTLFNYAAFEKNASFSNARFLSSAEFVHTTFGGSTNFENAYFSDVVKTEGVENIDFSKAFFIQKQEMKGK